MQLRTDMQQYRIDRPDRPEYHEMSADKEHLYLMDVETLDSLAGNDVFHPRPAGFFSNIVELGGWLSVRRTAWKHWRPMEWRTRTAASRAAMSIW